MFTSIGKIVEKSERGRTGTPKKRAQQDTLESEFEKSVA
jgi:hypothetical protein